MAKNSSAPKKPRTKANAPGAVSGDAGPGHNSDKVELTPDERRKLFLNHRTAWNNMLAKEAVYDKFAKDVKDALKSDGFTINEMKIADSLLDVAGEAKIKSEIEDRLRVAQWIGHPLGAQMDLFAQPDRTPIVDRAYDAGKQASMENQAKRPPHAPETEAYRAWCAGYDDHQRQLIGGLKAPSSMDQSTLANRAAAASTN